MAKSVDSMNLTVPQSARRLAELLSRLMASDDGLADWLEQNAITLDYIRWLQAQGVASFVYYRLQQAHLLCRLDETVVAALQSISYVEQAQSILLIEELDQLLTDLRNAQLEPVVLKGMALALTVYPLPYTRPMADIDLLIDHSEVETIKRVFTARGYGDMGLQNERLSAFPSHLHVWREYPGGQRLTVEAHWNLFHESTYRDINLDNLRARIQHVREGERTLLMLEPIDHLLYACGHLLVHHAYGWIAIWLLDLRLIVERYSASWDWSQVIARAQGLKLCGALAYWLEIAEAWCGPFLTPEIRDRLGAIVPDPEEMWYLTAAQGDTLRVWQVFQQRGHGRGMREKLRLYRQILFPPWTYMQYRYRARTRWLAPIYYSWRLLRAAAVSLRRY
jgi:hypothetical protein